MYRKRLKFRQFCRHSVISMTRWGLERTGRGGHVGWRRGERLVSTEVPLSAREHQPLDDEQDEDEQRDEHDERDGYQHPELNVRAQQAVSALFRRRRVLCSHKRSESMMHYC